MNDILINLSNGTRIYSPADLTSISTYVLLEQEAWFEKEFGFVDKLLLPGMHAVDIGANLGTFTMAMAKAVGPAGRVTSYEPTSTTRSRLVRTRDENGAAQVEVVGRALSDGERTGRMVFESSSELNHLGAVGEGEGGEEVEITSLDIEVRRLDWPAPYFLKIDAEGEEAAILRGGRKLLTEFSPVLMLELKAGNTVNDGLIDAAGELGLRPFSLLRAGEVLMPFDRNKIDPYELNFFAIDDRRAAELESRGLLLTSAPVSAAQTGDVEAVLSKLRQQPFAAAFEVQFAASTQVNPEYAQSLVDYAIWQDKNLPISRRVGALQAAYSRLRSLCDSDGRIGRMATLLRVATDAGEMFFARQLCDLIQLEAKGGRLAIGEPFWPPMSRYDTVDPAGKPAQWFMASICELREQLNAFSSAFATPTNTLAWLCDSGFASAEMQRRRALTRILSGRVLDLPPVLLSDAPDNVNAALWRDGTVAGLARTIQPA